LRQWVLSLPYRLRYFVNGIDTSMSEAGASLVALAQRLGPQLQGDGLNFALAYNDTSVSLCRPSA
jgi:hypothetical protein